MLRLRILLCTLISFAFLPVKANYPQATHLLDSLDYHLSNQDKYRDLKCAKIKAKKNALAATSDPCMRLPIYEEIISEYLHVDADSAMRYADLAIRLCEKCDDTSGLARFRVLHSCALTNQGEMNLATALFDNINTDDICPADKVKYYEAGFNIYNRAFIYLRDDNRAKTFETKIKLMLDSLNSGLNSDNTLRRYYNDLIDIHSKNNINAVADLIDLLTSSTPNTYIYGQMAEEVAHYYVKEGQNDLAKYYFTIAAISNIRGGFSYSEPLHGLGMILRNEGDIAHSNVYLKTALTRALEANDDAEAMHISQSLETLLNDISQDSQKRDKFYFSALIILLLMLVAAVCLIFYFHSKRNSLTKRSKHLSQKHNRKDTFIKQLLSIYLTQIIGFEDYNRLVSRKIKAAQVTDLLRLAESGSIISDTITKFQNDFDNAFLALHPDFIENVNSLLLDDKKFSPLTSASLNTEQRYLAFLSLGIDDYQQIAVLLGITQNSAYTYKNKLKSRAIDRDKFEENIAKLA